jgi:hypothetical protein
MYAMETIGHLKAWDNVDGLFADYVAQAYNEYFSQQTRFIAQDISKGENLLTQSKIPYVKLIEDKEVLGQLSRAMRVESLIRTKVTKEGPSYRFNLEWLHTPKMDLLATETFTLQEPGDGKSFGLGNIKGSLQEALDRMIKKVPFTAQVTGRDNNSVTVNVGKASNIRRGDTLVIATLEEIKRHPLLKSIVDWRMAQIGKIEIEDVDEKIAFGRVVEEEPGRQISRFQKVVQIIPKAIPLAPEVQIEESEETKSINSPPSLGWVNGSIIVGSLDREISDSTNAGQKGSGFFYGGIGEAQLWLTRQWFVDLQLGGGTSSFTQKNISTNAETASGVNGTMFFGKFDVGYTFFTTTQLFGPKGFVRLGYQWTNYGFPQMPALLLVPSSYGGLFVGIGGELPVRDEWGIAVTLDFGLINSATVSDLSYGEVRGSQHLAFFIGTYYRLNQRLNFRAGMTLMADSADFANSASLSNRLTSFGPSLQYYF